VSNRDAKKNTKNPLLPPRFRQKPRKPLKKKPKAPQKKVSKKLPPLTPREVARIERYKELQALQKAGRTETIEFQLLINKKPPRPPWDTRRAPKKKPKKRRASMAEMKERFLEHEAQEKERREREAKKRPWRLPVQYITWKEVKLSDAFIYSTKLIQQFPTEEFLERTIVSYVSNVAAKGGFEPEDLSITNHGFFLRPLLQTFDRTDAVQHLRDELQNILPRGSKIVAIQESHLQGLVRVVIPVEPPRGLDKALAHVPLIHEALVIGLETFRVFFDDIYWGYYFESMEEVYEKLPNQKKKVSYERAR